MFIYSILAIGLISIPSFLDTVQAQTNMTNTTSSSGQNQTAQGAQNQTMSKETQALMALDIPTIKEQLMNAKQSLVNGNMEEALAGITDVEIPLLLAQNKPSFVGDLQEIKNSISEKDVNKALDDLTKVQTDIVKAETEILKAQLTNPQ
ncbi:MAG TPA: hypothetical protein VJU85_04565 [Nitrososphaeraceae archaeon]|nr:hypothetical protein [Nitrososphaeraceae archaeon]